MKISKIDLGETGNFSPIFLDYIQRSEKLNNFYHLFPSPENFKQTIESQQHSPEKRKRLQEVIKEQYKGLKISKVTETNIDTLVNENTFTITTGHQLNIFTGPLYFIYKIVTIIKTCQHLKRQYPDNHFVPIYWMATEDHDFEEISKFRLFGKQFEWVTKQQGAVGRFDPSSLEVLLNELPEKITLFEEAYLKSDTLANATRYFINELFKEEGLIALDADHPKLKSLLIPIIKDELNNNLCNRMVEDESKVLDELGYKTQVFPRNINLFYLDNTIRERIILEGDTYNVNNTDIEFTRKEILQLVENHPEKFSPNVILRPVYQEIILPNLAYIGGPAEIAYWLQLKKIFEHFQVNFPILMPRNFGLVVNAASQRKILNLGLEVKDLFGDVNQLKNNYVSDQSVYQLNLEREKEILNEVFISIKNQAATVDKSLEGFIGAEASKMIKNIENIEKRLKKAEEKKHEKEINSIIKLKDKLFPDGNLQERVDNFLNFYINHPDFIKQILEAFDPFDFNFYILIEDE